VLAQPPYISDRSDVEIPWSLRNTGNNVDNGYASPYILYNSVAANTKFALFGSFMPRLHTSLWIVNWNTYPYEFDHDAIYRANPVIVTEPPWTDGTPFSAHKTIEPPVNPLGVERFGAALAIQGNRVAIGSPDVFTWTTSFCCGYPEEDWIVGVSRTATGSGRVHLYQYNGTSFVPERTIVHGDFYERFGAAIALNSTHMLVGRPGRYLSSPGAADLFDPNTGDLITTFYSPSTYDFFGEAVALAGDIALVGARYESIVYVYRHDGAGNWSPAGELTSPGSGSRFGTSIAADGERILVGAPNIDRAYIFEDDGDSDWPVVAELSGGAGSRFGEAVALVGDSAFIGAPYFTFGPLTSMGTVIRHDRASDGTWPFTTNKNARTPASGGRFGAGIAASTGMLAVLETGKPVAFGEADRPSKMSVFTGPTPGC